MRRRDFLKNMALMGCVVPFAPSLAFTNAPPVATAGMVTYFQPGQAWMNSRTNEVIKVITVHLDKLVVERGDG